ncbi:MAG: hypothetical protein LBI99_03860 [Propionibacteriaceae bacterium]|jgi:hypothetical protein|nr:hypothetical protein [Propionibacteriaceae bacterium]
MLKPPKPLKTLAVIPLIGALVLLAGCTFTISGPNSTSTEPVVIGTPPENEEPIPQLNTDVTPPGTKLGIDEAIVVPFKYGDGDTQIIQVFITGIRSGSPDDFANADEEFKKNLGDRVPYYVDISAKVVGTNTGALAQASISSTQIGAGDKQGNRFGPVIAFADFAPCNTEYFDESGTELKTCIPFLAAAGQSLDYVFWVDNSDPSFGYDEFEGDPIIWG